MLKAIAVLMLFSDGLTEVTVTAQMREESIQHTPVAVTAIGTESLERTPTLDLRDLNGDIPNAVITNFVNGALTAVISVRGISVQELDGFVDPAVSVVVDGVPQGSNTMALLDLFDIERIEVLRGPQGTLFGANSIGGVINVITRQPTGRLGGRSRLTLGGHGRFNVAGMLDFPVSGRVAGKVSVMKKQFDGYYTDLVSGRTTGGQIVTSARAYLKFTATEDAGATLQYEYGRGRNDSTPIINLAVPGQVLFVPPGHPVDAHGEPLVDFETASQDFNFSNFDIQGFTLTGRWGTGALEWTSISHYRDFQLDEWTDQDATPLFLLNSLRLSAYRQLSQELRAMLHPTGSTELQIGGVYFFKNYKLSQTLQLEALTPGLVQQLTNDQDDRSWAGFAQGYWNLTDALKAQAGVRYTWQEKDMRVTNANAVGGFPVSDVLAVGTKAWTHWGWRVGADYRWTDAIMIYGYQGRAAHSGGFNGRITFAQDIGPYDPETVDTYEIGAKSEWLSRRLRVNAAAFYTRHRDMQVDQLSFVNNNPTTQVLNAASATLQGVELETVLAPTDHVALRGSIGFLDARFDRFFLDLDGNPANGQEDGSSLELRQAPRWQTKLGLTYILRHTTFNVDWNYSTHRHTDARNHPAGCVRPLSLVEASLRWPLFKDRGSISLWSKNLLDERYVASAFFVPFITTLGAYGAPREYGIDFAYKLGE